MGVAVAKSSGVVARGFRRHERNGAWGAAKEWVGHGADGREPEPRPERGVLRVRALRRVREVFVRALELADAARERLELRAFPRARRRRRRAVPAEARVARGFRPGRVGGVGGRVRLLSRTDGLPLARGVVREGAAVREGGAGALFARTSAGVPGREGRGRTPRTRRRPPRRCGRPRRRSRSSGTPRSARRRPRRRAGASTGRRAPWREPREVRAEARRGEAFSAAETRRATRREGRDGDAMVAPSSSRGPRPRRARRPRPGRTRTREGPRPRRRPRATRRSRTGRRPRRRSRAPAWTGTRRARRRRPSRGRVEREFALEERAQRRVGRRRGNGRGGGHRRNARRARARGREEGRRGPRGARRASASGALGAAEMRRFPGTISTPGVFRGDVDWPISGRRFVRGREPPKRPIQ